MTFENLEVIPSAVKPVIKNIETGISEKILIEERVIIAFLVERGSTQNGRSSDEIYARLNSVLGKEFSVGSLKTAISNLRNALKTLFGDTIQIYRRPDDGSYILLKAN